MRLTLSPAAILALVITFSTSSSTSAMSESSGTYHSPGLHRSLMRSVRRAVGISEEAHEPHYVHLQKRFSGRATFYNNEVSEGACGGYSSNSDFVVALNVGQYGSPNARSSWCGKKINISYGGQTHSATVVDCCPSCPYGGLDMSPGLFDAFADASAGIFQMTWSAGGGGGSSSSNSNNNNDNAQEKKPKYTPKTTSTSTRHSTHTTQPRTSSTPSSTSTTSSSTSSTSSSSTTSNTESATTTPISPNNLEDLTEVMRGMMDLANAVQAQ